MKNKINLIMVLLLTILLTSCTTNNDNDKDNPLLNDTVAPILTILDSEKKVTIKQGEEYDLMKGISAFDNLEKDIIKRVQILDDEYDNNVPGTYSILYFLADTAGNSAEPVERIIVVLNTSILVAPPIFTGIIENEAPKPETPTLFRGAWYHKVVSSRDKWAGIEGTFTLPTVKITRYKGSYNSELDVDPNGVNLDNPSVYMGGNATYESDVGLSFSKALINVQSNTLSKGSIAFRPFCRYITKNAEDKDIGGYDLANGRRYAVSATNSTGDNMIANWYYGDTEYYYLPGDKLRMIIYSPEPNKSQLQIEVIEVSKDPVSVQMRKQYGWKNPENFISPIFASPGSGINGNVEYKRVNAIDQSNNENKDAIDTTTLISNAIWHEAYLYRMIDGVLYRVPFTDERRNYISAKDASKFTISYDGVDTSKGGEVITIHPGYSNK